MSVYQAAGTKVNTAISAQDPKLTYNDCKSTCECTVYKVDKCNYISLTYVSFLCLFTIVFPFVHLLFPIFIMVVLAPWSCCGGNLILSMVFSQCWLVLSWGAWKTEFKIGRCALIPIVSTLFSIVF